MTDRKRTLVVVSHTHWDREWYQPFEEFRARLVRMMDSLLDLLERDPEFRHFVVDGQTVPLDDYLEIRPERRAQIERLIREGRLLAGPNYILPDEFLIGGEAWVRNLMYGVRSARAYGRAMMVGYSPDAFGHMAHLPAVLRGFGIDSVLIWRGVGRNATTSEFRWRAPDGSEILAVHFPYGYGMMPALPEDSEQLRPALDSVRRLLEPLATTSYVLVPNGTDHLPAHEGLSGVIRKANELLDDAIVVHGDYPAFVASVREELGERYTELPVIEGELRDSSRSNILPGVLSTRIWLKQRYAACEDLLCHYAEPLVSWVHLLSAGNGASPDRWASDKGLLRHAWTLLLQNGPHDSVTGCSVDAVYEDVRLRFDRCEQVAGSLIHEALRFLGEAASPQGSQSVIVFNPEHGPRTDVCTVRLPVEDGRLPSALISASGERVPLQVVERGGHSPLDRRERVVTAFIAGAMPGFAYRSYGLEYGEAVDAGAAGGGEIQNEFFRVAADPADGTLQVTDLRTGRVLAGLNRFVDSGDRGDEYNYNAPAIDDVIAAPAFPPVVRVTERGPVRWTLEVVLRYSLPVSLSADRRGRFTEAVECPITTRARLYPGVPRVDVETVVTNAAKDHRLRVHFPSGIRADGVEAEQHFGVVDRPIELPEYDSSWFEVPVGTHPAKTFVDVSDGQHGLMIANRGLPEYEVYREADGTATVALTLLRCVEWLSRDDLDVRRGHAGPGMHTPGAQMLGTWRFEYAIIPHDRRWTEAYHEAHRFNRPLRAIRVSRGRGVMAPEGALLDVKPADFIVSAIKPAEDGDGVAVRLYNISEVEREGRLRMLAPAGAATRVNLNEEEPAPAPPVEGAVPLTLGRNEIATLRFESHGA